MPAANINSTVETIARNEWSAVDFDAKGLRKILADYSTRIEPDSSATDGPHSLGRRSLWIVNASICAR